MCFFSFMFFFQIYERSEFYRMADEYGIMIWQDMMFAGSMYPVDGHFLTTVRTEIRQQVVKTPVIGSCILTTSSSLSLRNNWDQYVSSVFYAY